MWAFVVVAPATRRGWLLLIDWVAGPHPSIPRAAWGLDTGLWYGPFPLLGLAVGGIIGHATAAWLFVAAVFPVAALGIGRLVGGSLVRRAAGALLYCVNPFVLERLAAGQVVFLLAYALFPFAVHSILVAVDAIGVRRLLPAAWIAALVAILPHWAWLAGLVVVCVAVQRRNLRALAWVAAVAGAAAVLSAHMLAQQVGRRPAVVLGDEHLRAFATRGEDHVGLFPNVAALYGFFRPVHSIPKQLGGWMFLFAGLVLVMTVGALALRRAEPEWRRRAAALGSAGAVAYVLALGGQGPTGPLYRWAVLHLPGFAVMREPQKFVAVLALLYAVLFAFGVEQLVHRAGGRRGRLASAVLACLLVFGYTPDLAWGASGRLAPRRYPDGWWQADAAVGSGSGKILFLPWHKFLALPFTDGEIVANPAGHFFRRDVLSGDDPELLDAGRVFESARSEFLEALFREGSRGCRAGELLAPLGVEYLVLAKTLDWHRFAWLADQADLRPILENEDLMVYRNASYVGPGYAVPAARTVSDVAQAVRVTCTRSSLAEALLPPNGSTIEPPNLAGGDPALAPAIMEQRSPVTYEVRRAPAGWVILSEPYDPRWRWDDRRPVPLLQGVIGYRIGSTEPGMVRFEGWDRARIGYVVSAIAAAALCLATRRRTVVRRTP